MWRLAPERTRQLMAAYSSKVSGKTGKKVKRESTSRLNTMNPIELNRTVNISWSEKDQVQREKIIHSSKGQQIRTSLKRNETTNKGGREKIDIQLGQAELEDMVIYKDDDVIALNKLEGLAVHGGPKLSLDLSQCLHYLQYDYPEPPQLAHRLDKMTSGVLLLTRHKEAAKWIAQLFKQRAIVRTYWAITVGVPEKWKGSIKSALAVRNIASKEGRFMNRVTMIESNDSTKMACTDYEVLAVPEMSPARCCLMQLHPITARL